MKTLKERMMYESAEYLKDDFKKQLIELLQNALAEEINAWYGYFISKDFIVGGGQRKAVQEFYEEAGKDELYDHAAWLLERINQLGGAPGQLVTPDGLKMAKHQYINPGEADYTGDMTTNYKFETLKTLEKNVQNELGAIETYKYLEEFSRDIDPVTNKKVKEILADEEEHLQELQEFIDDINADMKKCDDNVIYNKPLVQSLEPTITVDDPEGTVISDDDVKDAGDAVGDALDALF